MQASSCWKLMRAALARKRLLCPLPNRHPILTHAHTDGKEKPGLGRVPDGRCAKVVSWRVGELMQPTETDDEMRSTETDEAMQSTETDGGYAVHRDRRVDAVHRDR